MRHRRWTRCRRSSTIASARTSRAGPSGLHGGRLTVKPIGITMGDASGIGPEIIAALFAQGLPEPALVIGDAAAMRRGVAIAGLDLTVRPIESPSAWRGRPGTIEVIETSQLPDDLPLGRVDARA